MDRTGKSQRGNMNATQQELVTANMGLVYHIFHKLKDNSWKWGHEQDLVSEGMVGLVKAAKTFDPSRGYKFATYATMCIRNEMFIYLRKLRQIGGDPVLASTVIDDEDGEPLTLALTSAFQDESADREINANDARQEINWLLKHTTALQQNVVKLKLAGLKQKEIAQGLGKSQAYVASIFWRFKKHAKRQQGQDMRDELYAMRLDKLRSP